MIKHFIWQWRVYQALKFNTRIYWLQKIPFVGKWVSSDWYKSQGTKRLLNIIVAIFNFVGTVINKAAYYFFLFGVASFLMEMSNGSTVSTLAQKQQSYLFILFVLGGVMGTVLKLAPITREDQLEVIFIKIFSITPYNYYRGKYYRQYLEYLIYDSLIAACVFGLNGLNPMRAVCFIAGVTGLRFLLTVLGFRLYRPDSKYPDGIQIAIIMLVFFIGSLAGGIIFWENIHLKLSLAPFFGLPALFGGLFMGLIALLLLSRWGTFINRLTYRLMSFETLKTLQIDTKNIDAKQVEMDEKDIHMQMGAKGLTGDFENNRTESESMQTNESGIAYLNRIFFKRLGHLFFKQIRNRVIILTLLFVVGIGASIYFKPYLFDENGESVLDVLPFLSVIICYGMNIGEYFTKFCFYNLDRNMIHYRFYRQPEMVLQSIKIRFAKNFLYNVPLLIVLIIGSGILYWIINPGNQSLLVLIWATQIMSMLFFSMHFLIMYYILQPFTVSMQAKSPAYTVINALIYLFVFFSHNLLGAENFMLYPVIIIVVALIYIPIGLYLVRKLAPKNFKLR